MKSIIIKKDNDLKALKFVLYYLHQYNRAHCDYIKNNSNQEHNNKINGDFIIYDKDKIIGGAIGYIRFKWYFLTDLYLEEEYRKNKLGTKILMEVEKFAKEQKALGIRVESWDFQAPKFYQKLGYQVYAIFEDCPPGTKEYLLYKKFEN